MNGERRNYPPDGPSRRAVAVLVVLLVLVVCLSLIEKTIA